MGYKDNWPFVFPPVSLKKKFVRKVELLQNLFLNNTKCRLTDEHKGALHRSLGTDEKYAHDKAKSKKAKVEREDSGYIHTIYISDRFSRQHEKLSGFV